MKLSDKIRILRKARGLSQEQLGYSLSRVNKDGISRQTVSDWENGNFEPKLENIRDLAEVLNVSFDALLDESVNLDDGKVLYAVLNRIDLKKQKSEEISNSFSYSIYPYESDKRALVKIILTPIADILAIVSAVLFIYRLVKGDVGFFTWFWMIVCCASFAIGLSFTISLSRNIRLMIHGKFRAQCATLTNDYLHISTYQSASNSIYIPLEKIEKMEIGEKANKRHGEVKVFIKDRNRPVTFIDIKEPYKLIEVFNSLDSYVENPDEIKIL